MPQPGSYTVRMYFILSTLASGGLYVLACRALNGQSPVYLSLNTLLLALFNLRLNICSSMYETEDLVQQSLIVCGTERH